MEDTKTYIHWITRDILDNFFPQIDTLSEIITPDPKRATRIIINRIMRTIDEFETYCPLTAMQRITPDDEGCYTFKDNYLDIVEGRESIENLELIPRTIARVGGNSFATFTRMPRTANYWHYRAPTLKCFTRGAEILVHAMYHYPIYIRMTDDDLITNDSHIYGLDKEQKHMLMNLMELNFLKLIKGNMSRVKLPGASVEFLDVDQDIQDLKEQVEQDVQACSAIKIAWV